MNKTTQKRNDHFLENKSDALPTTTPEIIVATEDIGPTIAPNKLSENYLINK